MIAESWHDLEAELLGPEPDYDTDPEPIGTADRDQANRHLARIAKLDAAIDADIEVAEAQIERTTAWLESRRTVHAAQRRWHEQILERYHRAVLSVDPRLKTIKLPNGTLRARAQQPEWEWEDDGKVFGQWVWENRPDLAEALVAFPPAPDPKLVVTEAKKALTIEERKGSKVVARTFGKLEDGTAPAGVKVTERDDKFDVVLADDEVDE